MRPSQTKVEEIFEHNDLADEVLKLVFEPGRLTPTELGARLDECFTLEQARIVIERLLKTNEFELTEKIDLIDEILRPRQETSRAAQELLNKIARDGLANTLSESYNLSGLWAPVLLNYWMPLRHGLERLAKSTLPLTVCHKEEPRCTIEWSTGQAPGQAGVAFRSRVQELTDKAVCHVIFDGFVFQSVEFDLVLDSSVWLVQQDLIESDLMTPPT